MWRKWHRWRWCATSFRLKQSARVFSLLFLIIGVSPLLAPSLGTLLLLWLGWQSIFIALALFTAATLVVVALYLPERHGPDPSVSLAPQQMIRTFWQVLTERQFLTYSLAGAFSFAGLFAYVAGSPIVFMDGFKVSERMFGIIFAVLTLSFIGGSQVNVLLLRRLSSQRIFAAALTVQVSLGVVFWVGSRFGWYGIGPTLVLFFVSLSCIGLTYPNAAATALAPFSRNVGSASALLGCIQMGTGAATSTGVGLFGATSVVTLLSGSAVVAVILFLVGRRFVGEPQMASEDTLVPVVH